MPKLSEDISNAFEDIIAFLRGKKADINLEFQESQKTALYQIRDLLIKPERELIKIEQYTALSIDTSAVDTFLIMLGVPPDKHSICITNLILSANTEMVVGLYHVTPRDPIFDPQGLSSSFWLAERGGVAHHFGKDTPLISPPKRRVLLDWNITSDPADRLSIYMNYYYKIIKPMDT